MAAANSVSLLSESASPAGTRRAEQPGFTLIEVLVVVAIIALMVAILAPALSQSRNAARSAVCLSNLRQMTIAAHGYADTYKGRYPPYSYNDPNGSVSHGWDLITSSEWIDGQNTTRSGPGLLWQGRTIPLINQCPSYRGKDNWADYPYTGYNYNTSYVGWCVYRAELDSKWQPTGGIIADENPARTDDIKTPTRCALFGDGEYSQGANKFMRSPFGGRDAGYFSGRSAGTQGYRHMKMTNVAWSDGHAESWRPRHVETYNHDKPNIAPNTGFLSPNNNMYDLQ